MSKVKNLIAYKDDKSQNSILRIVGSYSRFGVGYVAEGDSGVQHDGGPQVPGPWAFAYELSHMLTNEPIEVKEAKAKDEFDRTTYVETGDKVRVDGNVYEVSINGTINCGLDIDFKKL
jgi:hypothetical protein